MLSTTYELLIEDFLLSESRSMLIRPQYWLRASSKSRAPDVLGVDRGHCVFYLAEVTANQHPVQLLDKLRDYQAGEERILAGLKYEFLGNSASGDWTVMPWLFIWDGLKEPLKSALGAFHVKTTYLQQLLKPTTYSVDTVPKEWGLTAKEQKTLTPKEREWLTLTPKERELLKRRQAEPISSANPA